MKNETFKTWNQITDINGTDMSGRYKILSENTIHGTKCYVIQDNDGVNNEIHIVSIGQVTNETVKFD